MNEPSASFVAPTPEMAAVARRDPPDLRRAESVDNGLGRIETSRIAVRTTLSARIDQNWPSLTAVCRIERIRETKVSCRGVFGPGIS